jgi:type I restriction enzyme S subunit
LKLRLNTNVIDNQFFIYLFHISIKGKVNDDAKGSAMKNLSSIGYLKRNLLVPLPPLPEQERIVAKLGKLMKFCDVLEANIKQGISDADRLLQTVLRETLEPEHTRVGVDQCT